jgi:hypothetical protein
MLTFSGLAKGDHFRFCEPLSGEPYGEVQVKTSARWYYDFRNQRKFTTGAKVRVRLVEECACSIEDKGKLASAV